MATQNLKKKKTNNHSINREKVRSLKDSAIIKSSPKKQAGRFNQEELFETERFLSNIFSSIQDGISILDKDMNIIRVNQAMERWYSHAMPLIGKKCYKAYHGRTERCDVCPTYQTIKTGKAAYEIVPKTGLDRKVVGWLDLYSFPLIDNITGKMKGVIEYVRDISDRKRTEEALHESERKYRELADFLPEAVCEADENGKILFANRCAFEIFGYTQEDFDKGLSLFEMVTPEERERVRQNLLKLFQGEKIISEEFTALRKDGRRFPIFASVNPIVRNNRPVGIRGVIVDITTRKQVEQEILDWKQRYELVTTASGQVVYDCNFAKGQIAWGGSVEEVFGYSIDDLNGGFKQWVDLIDPRDRDEALRLLEIAEKNLSPYEVEYGFRHKAGHYIRILDRGFVLESSEAKPERMIGMMQDITERKRAEAALQESEERHRTLVNSMQDGVYLFDKKGYFTYVNPIMEQRAGFPVEKFKTFHFLDILPPEFHEEARSNFERSLRGEQGPSFEMSYRTSHGAKLYMEVNTTPLFKEGEVVTIMGISHNITERKRAEEVLREKEALIDKSQAIAHVGSWELNLVANRLTWSDEVYRMFGLRPQEFDATYEAFLDTVHPDDRPAVDAAYSGSLREGCDTYQIEHRIIRRDSGEVRVVHEKCEHIKDASGRIVRSIGMVQDITEWKQAEKALQKSEERYRTILENIEDGYYEVNLPGDFTFFNDSLCRMLGYSRDEMMGMGNKQFTDEVNRKKLFQTFNEVYRTGRPTKAFDLEVIRKDGVKVFVEVSVSPLKDPNGQPIGFRGIARDVTHRKETEKALRHSEEKYRTILENIEDGYFEVNLAGNFTFFNESLSRMLGYSKEEMMGMNNRQYTDEKNAKKLYQAFNKVYRTGEPTKEFDWVIIRKDGAKRYIETSVSLRKDQNGQPIGFRGVVRDITERKIAAEALARSEEQYRTLVEESFDGIFTQKGVEIIFANRRFHEMLGYQEGELVGLDHWIVYHPDYRALTRERARARLRGESVPSTYEVKFLRKDGSSFWGEINAKAINILGVPGIQVWARDITEHKQAERALIESKERLGTILDGIDADIYIADIKTHEILFMNKHMKESFGDDLVGKVCWRVFRGDSGPCPHCTNPLLLDKEGNLAQVQVWEGRNPITNRYYLNYDRAIRWVDGRYVRLQVSTDITERKQVEEALRLSEYQYRTTIDSMGDGIHVVDNELRIILANKTLQQWNKKLGLETEIFNKIIFEVYPFLTEEVLDEYRAVFKNGKVLVTEEQNKVGNQEIITETRKIPIFEGEKVHRIVTVIQDITERKYSEQALRESEERYRLAIESSNDGVAIVRKDRHIYVNKQFVKMFGYDSIKEVLGQSSYAWIHPDDRERVMEFNRKRQRGENVPTRYETKGIRKDGEVVYLEISATRILLHGEFCTLAYLRDITDLKRAEDALHQTEEQLRQSQKMEAVGRLAGGIAHDFNNLLTVIKGYSELSLLGLKDGDPFKENIEEIYKASERAANLTRQLLAFSRRQILDFKVLNLNTLIQDLDKMLHRILGEDIELVYKLSERKGHVKIDPGQIEQVILNLSVNARDAMPSGGRLTIETSNVEMDKTYASMHPGLIPGRYVLLSITDTGVGMTPEIKERLFEPFFTTKEKGKGTGLGLSTVYGIIKQSSGQIEVESGVAQGTTFKIYLPRVEEEEDSLPQEKSLSPTKGTETILLVEDDSLVRELSARILRDQGYRLFIAADGEEAIHLVQDQLDGSIHLLFTDVVMPKMSGKELAENLKELIPGIKVLFASGYTDDAIVNHGVLNKGINFIQKPFTPEALARKVREVLDG